MKNKKIWPSFYCTLGLPSFRRDSSRNPEMRRTGFQPESRNAADWIPAKGMPE